MIDIDLQPGVSTYPDGPLYVFYLLSREHLEAIVETMELLANPKARRAIDEHRAGRTRFLPLTALDDE